MPEKNEMIIGETFNAQTIRSSLSTFKTLRFNNTKNISAQVLIEMLDKTISPKLTNIIFGENCHFSRETTKQQLDKVREILNKRKIAYPGYITTANKINKTGSAIEAPAELQSQGSYESSSDDDSVVLSEDDSYSSTTPYPEMTIRARNSKELNNVLMSDDDTLSSESSAGATVTSSSLTSTKSYSSQRTDSFSNVVVTLTDERHAVDFDKIKPSDFIKVRSLICYDGTLNAAQLNKMMDAIKKGDLEKIVITNNDAISEFKMPDSVKFPNLTEINVSGTKISVQAIMNLIKASSVPNMRMNVENCSFEPKPSHQELQFLHNLIAKKSQDNSNIKSLNFLQQKIKLLPPISDNPVVETISALKTTHKNLTVLRRQVQTACTEYNLDQVEVREEAKSSSVSMVRKRDNQKLLEASTGQVKIYKAFLSAKVMPQNKEDPDLRAKADIILTSLGIPPEFPEKLYFKNKDENKELVKVLEALLEEKRDDSRHSPVSVSSYGY